MIEEDPMIKNDLVTWEIQEWIPINESQTKLFITDASEYFNDFASKILRELPKNIKLGTDVIFNVKALENDFNAIKEKIDERVDKK